MPRDLYTVFIRLALHFIQMLNLDNQQNLSNIK